ncbi:MAG: SDR family oxidoreductase [Propionicimonas sp.]|uniref:SDR family oxidoreductase n=1 Tax=Propionicimonas sp. TaxID=1955623 RepID=UPI002B1F809B|nr:SDR family oxidoreductase [Propionicimonas sp.]MEA4943499.1 SDR family oxidoreductase [Propionicimonas sp.]
MSRPVALVTGASRGIGRAIARELGSTHHLLVGARTAGAAREVADSLPSAEPFVADLTDEAAVAAAVAGIDRLDVLVHSAGMLSHWGPFETATTDQWRAVLELNVIAPATLTRLLLPALRAAHGLVVFLNSGAGLTGNRGFSVYAASKFALTGLAQSLREDERGAVRVTSLHPGRVATDMQLELRTAEGREFTPEDYLAADDVARTVRLAVDLPPSASVEMLRINHS